MNLIKIFLTIIVLLITVVICTVKPVLHKEFVIKDSNFKLARYSEKTVTKVINKQDEYGSNRKVMIEPSAFLSEEKNILQNENQSSTEKVIIDKNLNGEEQVIIGSDNHPELQDATELKTDKQNAKSSKKLTKREEIIAWNKWRSNLQNEIMTKSEVDGTIGTMYYFSFKVDKYRHLSDIKAFCANPIFQKEINDKLIPTIKKMEYSKILEFPEGSERDSTKFSGMFVIWDETSLSTPKDFNDLERVNVYE